MIYINKNGKNGKKKGVKGLQLKNQVKPKQLNLGNSVPVLFKQKMFEKLEPEKLNKKAKNIGNITLQDLRDMADAACREIQREKEGKKSYNAKINETTVKTDYNLIETFILYLFKEKKFVKGLQYLTKNKTQIKINKTLKAPNGLVNQPIIEYFKPYFEDNPLLIENDTQMPNFIKNVFENFCINMSREKNVDIKLYRINKNFFDEKKQKKLENTIEQQKENGKISAKLKKLGWAEPELRIPHTPQLIKAIKECESSGKTAPKKARALKKARAIKKAEKIINDYKKNKKYNKKGGMFKTEYINNNSLLDEDMEIEIEEPKIMKKQLNNLHNIKKQMDKPLNNFLYNYIEDKSEKPKNNIKNNAYNKFNKKENSDLENLLNKKRKTIQDIEELQNNKKVKYTDNNKAQDQKLKEPDVMAQTTTINNTQPNFNQLLGNLNFIQPQLSQQINNTQQNLNQLLGNLNFIQQEIETRRIINNMRMINNTQPNFNQLLGNLNFIRQEIETRRIINDMRVMNLLNSAYNNLSKNK